MDKEKAINILGYNVVPDSIELPVLREFVGMLQETQATKFNDHTDYGGDTQSHTDSGGGSNGVWAEHEDSYHTSAGIHTDHSDCNDD